MIGNLEPEEHVIFFQAEDGIRDVERSRGLGDVYKRQIHRGVLKNSNSLCFTVQRPNPHTRNFEIFKAFTYHIEEFTHLHKGVLKFSNSLHLSLIHI